METKERTESGNQGLSLPLLKLMAAPLQLLSAAMWQVVQRGLVSHYGMLEEFVTTVTELVPELMSYRQRAQLILGLRARLVLDLCDGDHPADHNTIQVHLDRIKAPIGTHIDHHVIAQVEETEVNFVELVHTLMDNPSEREHFFQEVFPVHFGARYDTALEILLWEFISRLEQLLPVPDFAQMVSWLSDAPCVLDEYLQSATPPAEMKATLQDHTNLSLMDVKEASSLPMDDCILAALSLHPAARTNTRTARPSPKREEGSEVPFNDSNAEKGKRRASERTRKRLKEEEEEEVENVSPPYQTAGHASARETTAGWTDRRPHRKRKLSDSLVEVLPKQPTDAAMFMDSSEDLDHPGESPLISIWGEYADPQEAAYPVTTDAKVPWSDEETLNLLDIWGKDTVQKVLKGCVKNRHIFTLISRKMCERGFVRTVEQCQTRIKRLKKCFRQCVQHNSSGNPRLECKFYEQLERILGDAAPATSEVSYHDDDVERDRPQERDQPQDNEEGPFVGHSGLETLGTRSVPWTDLETLTLIHIWGEAGMQRELKGMHRNGHIFAVISNKMAAQGFTRSAEQCQTRVKRLKASFRQCYENNVKGGEHVECKFYDQLERILVNELPTLGSSYGSTYGSAHGSAAEHSLDLDEESGQGDHPDQDPSLPPYQDMDPGVGALEERRKVPWGDGETLVLLELWGDEKVQLDLRRCPHNGHIYSGVSDRLTGRGFYRTAEQCHTRIKRLKASYRQCQESLSSSGSERVDFKFYDLLEQILERQPSTTTESFEMADDSNNNSMNYTDLEEEDSTVASVKASQSSWSDSETLALLDIWREREVLKNLRVFVHNGHVYNDISEKMHSRGHTKTAEQCCWKIKSLRNDFRQCYDRKKSGRSRAECKFYAQLEGILLQDAASIDEYDQRDEQADQDSGDDGLISAPWLESETLALIQLWGSEEEQQHLEGCLRSDQTSADISDKMAALGYFRTAEQCRSRMEQLRRTRRNGEEPPVFGYYSALEALQGDDAEDTDDPAAEEEPAYTHISDVSCPEDQTSSGRALGESSRKMPWSERETRALLEIWGERGVQVKLRACMKNRHVFELISQRMAGRGFVRTAEQCHTRIKRLKAGYLHEKEKFKYHEIFSREFDDENLATDSFEAEGPAACEPTQEPDHNDADQRVTDGSKFPWSDGETQVLLSLWGSEDIQENLRGCTKNKHIFTQISHAMGGLGYARTAEQCLSRVKRLKATFRQCCDSKRSGENVEWKFYSQFQQIFGIKDLDPDAETEEPNAVAREEPAKHRTH